MRVIIDCNIFVSAALGSDSCQQVIVTAIRRHHIFYSKAIKEEIERTFAKPKFSHIVPEGQRVIEQLERAGILLNPPPCRVHLPDTDDEIYLAAALHANADAIITGNTKDFPQKACGEIQILSPRKFIERTHYPTD